jgi:hypothetical protein
MPLGLSAVDFQSLESPTLDDPDYNHDPEGDITMPELTHDCLSESDDDGDSGYGASSDPSPLLDPDDDPSWSLDDDRVLVEAVLEKLQLSKRAWNDCARRLGRHKDSIGRRWRLLLDEGEVGLKIRRGGAVRRAAMDVPGW